MNTYSNSNPAIANHSLWASPWRNTSSVLLALASVWLVLVAALAERGVFAALPMTLIPALVGLGILLPTGAYFASPQLQRYAQLVGLQRLSLLHAWRVPAALVFFWFGALGQLPTLFWVLAGVGDLIAGLLAARLAIGTPSRVDYLRFHRLGFADFVLAVGTGLTFTLLQNPLMNNITLFPLALIPLFGVGISGATHLVAFHMLRKPD